MKVSLDQIRILKHTIGFREDKVKGRKYRKYSAWRNHFVTSENCDNFNSLNELVDLKLMTRRDDSLSDSYVFHVTEYGMKFLGELLGVIITEED